MVHVGAQFTKITGTIYKILVTEAQFASGSETIKDVQVRGKDSSFEIPIFHIGMS